jgi:Protein of unknown function (DUF632)
LFQKLNKNLIAVSRILGTLLSSASFHTSHRSTTAKLKGTGQLSGTEKLNEVEFNNLSSILDRLYAWEKRLYKEVKVCCTIAIHLLSNFMYAFAEVVKIYILTCRELNPL